MEVGKWSSVAGLLDAVREEKKRSRDEEALEEYERMARKVVSARLDATDIYRLDAVAKEMELSRTACAQKLLETAIHEMFYGLGLKGFTYEVTSADNGAVLVTVDGGKDSLIVRDDAVMIGGGDER